MTHVIGSLTRQEASQILYTLDKHHGLLPKRHTLLYRIPQHLERSTYITKRGILEVFESKRYPTKKGTPIASQQRYSLQNWLFRASEYALARPKIYLERLLLLW